MSNEEGRPSNHRGYLIEATLVPENDNDYHDGWHQQASPVEASAASLKDYLQSRRLQMFLLAVLCCFLITTAIIVLVLLFADPSRDSSNPVPPPSNNDSPNNKINPTVLVGGPSHVSTNQTVDRTGSITAPGTTLLKLPLLEAMAANQNLTTFVELIQMANLSGTLEGPGDFTIFAPTNDAFPEDLAAYSSPLEATQLPKSLATQKDALEEDLLATYPSLEKVLKYHITLGILPSRNLLEGNRFLTLEGGLTTIGDGPKVDDANITDMDLEGSNGVVHVIDAVLLESILHEDLQATQKPTDIFRVPVNGLFPPLLPAANTSASYVASTTPPGCLGVPHNATLNDPANATLLGVLGGGNNYYSDPSLGNDDCNVNSAWAFASESEGIQGEWFQGRATDDESKCTGLLEHLIRFKVPVVVSYDLIVYQHSLDQAQARIYNTTTQSNGLVEAIIQPDDEAGRDNSFDYWIQVRYTSGQSCKPWTLQIFSHI